MELFAMFSTQVFGHFRNWCKAGVWRSCWTELLKKNKSLIDLSSADLDGSHTTALRGGEQVAYQGRKNVKQRILYILQIVKVCH